jgi:hypothetical protein
MKAYRELNERTNDGITVRLLWDSIINQCYVEVEDCKYESVQTVAVPNNRAMDAFLHPFPYIGAHSVAV